jgi:hypothetical protein
MNKIEDNKVWITISRNVNLGNYENYKLEAGYSLTLQSGEDPMGLIADMEAQLRPFVAKQARFVKKERRRNRNYHDDDALNI